MYESTIYTKNIQSKTVKIDARGKILGRLAVKIADKLRGKDKPEFSYHQIIGDKVIVKNAGHIIVTGQKLFNKKYYRHSGYLGGIKEETLRDLLKRRPDQVIRRAVAGMLPKNRLHSKWLNNLTIYAEDKGDK